MKKLLALLLCVIFALTALCACEKDTKKDKDDKSDVSSESSESFEISEFSSESSDDVSVDFNDDVSDDVNDDVNSDVSNDISLVGTWEAEADYVEILFGEKQDINIPCTISFAFEEDEVSLNITFAQNNAEDLADALVRMTYIMFGGEDVMSYDEYLAEIDMDEILLSAEAMIEEGEMGEPSPYTLEGDKLTLDDSICKIKVDDDELTFLEIEYTLDDEEFYDETLGFIKALTFKKVA